MAQKRTIDFKKEVYQVGGLRTAGGTNPLNFFYMASFFIESLEHVDLFLFEVGTWLTEN